MASHSSILAWRIPRTEEPGGLLSVESKRVAHDWVTNSSTGAHWNKRSRHKGKLSPHSNKGPAQPEIKYIHRIKQCAVSASGFLPLAESVWGLSLSLMLLNCGVGEDSWESLGLRGDPTSPFWRRSALGFLWRERCGSWNCSTLATSCEELTHWKRLWC